MASLVRSFYLSLTTEEPTGKRREWNINRSPGCARFEPACSLATAFTDNPSSTARQKVTLPMGIEPTFPGLAPGVLSQLNYRNIQPSTWSPAKMADAIWPEGNSSCTSEDMMDKWRDRTEALHAGNRTRTAKAFATDGMPSLLVEENRSTSAHQK